MNFFFNPHLSIQFFKLILNREGWGEKERERERNIDELPPISALTGDQTHNLGMCFDQGSKTYKDDAPTN